MWKHCVIAKRLSKLFVCLCIASKLNFHFSMQRECVRQRMRMKVEIIHFYIVDKQSHDCFYRNKMINREGDREREREREEWRWWRIGGKHFNNIIWLILYKLESLPSQRTKLKYILAKESKRNGKGHERRHSEVRPSLKWFIQYLCIHIVFDTI